MRRRQRRVKDFMEQGYGDTGLWHAHPPGRIGPSQEARRSNRF
ncbi:hypothetical protein C7S15_7103 [Burkholderia cepacia]|nr:hypothetical protein [Burkholderia cepacia]